MFVYWSGASHKETQRRRSTMTVGWIDHIYNNTDQSIQMQSIDDRNNGLVRWSGPQFDLQDQLYHDFPQQTSFRADWCGIRWYYRGLHYKAIKAPGANNEVRAFQSFADGSNWIMFQNANTGALVGRQQVSKTVDYRCTLRYEPDPNNPAGGPLIFFDVINDDGSTQEA